MQKVTVSVKPRLGEDYLVISDSHMPTLLTRERTLIGRRPNHNGSPERKLWLVSVPENVASIGNYAFRAWKQLKQVCFLDTPYRMEAGVFADCPNLETAALAPGLETLPMGTFSGCRRLKQLELPGSIRRIHMDALKNCSALKHIWLPPLLETIEMGAFWGCRSLERVRLPESVKELGDSCFASCTDLGYIRLPSGLKSIGAFAFMNCTALEEIEIPAGITSLPIGVFAGCKSLERVVLPETLQWIHPYAFYGCERLVHPGVESQPRLPMALLNPVSGAVSGAMLGAMGYPGFEEDGEYRLFLTDRRGEIEVLARYQDLPGEEFFFDRWLMSEQLEPLPGTRPMQHLTEEELQQIRCTERSRL